MEEDETEENHRCFKIRYDHYIDMYEIGYNENRVAKYFIKHGYHVCMLKNMGADLIIEKNKKYTIIEIKRKIGQSNIETAIVQLLFAKKMLKKHFDIETTKMLILTMNQPNNDKNTRNKIQTAKRYIDAFGIRLQFLP